MSTWNYRIGTEVVEYPKSSRVYSVIECYYNKKTKKPHAYGETGILVNYESVGDLKSTYKYIKGAFSKPILDLDNFPKEYREKKKR